MPTCWIILTAKSFGSPRVSPKFPSIPRNRRISKLESFLRLSSVFRAINSAIFSELMPNSVSKKMSALAKGPDIAVPFCEFWEALFSFCSYEIFSTPETIFLLLSRLFVISRTYAKTLYIAHDNFDELYPLSRAIA